MYFLRWIIHNYSALYAISILRSLIPALKPGARIVINEHCLAEPGRKNESPWDERQMRDMDMIMLTLLNAEERDELTFRNLFAAADARFEFRVRLPIPWKISSPPPFPPCLNQACFDSAQRMQSDNISASKS